MIAELGTSNRQRALNAVLPAWLGRRRDVKLSAATLENAKADNKANLHELGEVEDLLAHVTQCRADDCLRCEELATNGIGA
jgi:hypothetical protein